MVDILVLGATGYTGRLITQYLYSHPQRSQFTLALGVRSKAKGESLKQSLALDDSVQLVQLDVTRYEQVEAAVKDAKVVINAVGPYWLWGTNVVRACAVHGKRYVDISGEPYFVRNIIDNFDYLSTKTGAIIVPSCGLDSLPADIAVYLSNRTLKQALGSQTHIGLSQSFYALRIKPSGGSLATLITMLEDVPRVRVEESFRDYALSPVPGAPSPAKRPTVRVPFSSPPQYAAPWQMGTTNRSIVQRTFGLYQYAYTNARALYGDRVGQEKEEKFRPLAYGPTFSYAEYLVPNGGGFLSAVLYSTMLAAAVGLLLITPIRWIVKKFFLIPAGDGPSPAELDKGFLKLTNYTVAAATPQLWARTTIYGEGDPGYRLTACEFPRSLDRPPDGEGRVYLRTPFVTADRFLCVGMVSESALALLLDDASLPVSARLGGILTPASAFGDVIVRRLEATGKVRFESEVVRDIEESRKDR
ncbi:Saccharopine dehydrogenase-domain-containing protein [Trametes polyzona]|nr:Saccharopine dehydrogenase-domain-containing protein [Trametes polyzona]